MVSVVLCDHQTTNGETFNCALNFYMTYSTYSSYLITGGCGDGFVYDPHNISNIVIKIIRKSWVFSMKKEKKTENHIPPIKQIWNWLCCFHKLSPLLQPRMEKMLMLHFFLKIRFKSTVCEIKITILPSNSGFECLIWARCLCIYLPIQIQMHVNK